MYGKDEAILMGEIWNLQKKKLNELTNTDEWWSSTIAEFNAIADKGKNEDVVTCLGYHCIAALRDIDAKVSGKQIKERLNYIGELPLEKLGEFLESARSGDSFKVNGVRLEVR